MPNYPTYNFSQITVGELITESYERNGLLGPQVSGDQRESAKRSLNFILTEWVNKGLNLFTVQQEMILLVPGQSMYSTPQGLVDIMEITKVQATRELDGEPFSSAGGIAENAFDGNPETACTQNAINGYISYNYGTSPQEIYYVGIQANENITYTLAFEYSYDDENWNEAMLTGPVAYQKGQQVWYVLPRPPLANVWRVRETGGAILNIQEIYFSVFSLSLPLERLSREDYISVSNKGQTGVPSSYYLARTVVPTLYIWTTPDNTYQYFVYNYTRQIPDVLKFTDTLAIPQRFLEAAVSALTVRLCVKFTDGSKYDTLKGEADDAYMLAAKEDIERVPLRLTINLVPYT